MPMAGYMQTSKTVEWGTPQYLYDELNAEFNFTCDVCATPANAKHKNFYTPEMDGLKQTWGGVCYCNPPYGRQIAEWVKKAANADAVTVMLLPARTDTKWFHDYIYGKAEIRFIKGRLHYNDSKEGAPFPSMIVIFRQNNGKANIPVRADL